MVCDGGLLAQRERGECSNPGLVKSTEPEPLELSDGCDLVSTWDRGKGHSRGSYPIHCTAAGFIAHKLTSTVLTPNHPSRQSRTTWRFLSSVCWESWYFSKRKPERDDMTRGSHKLSLDQAVKKHTWVQSGLVAYIAAIQGGHTCTVNISPVSTH